MNTITEVQRKVKELDYQIGQYKNIRNLLIFVGSKRDDLIMDLVMKQAACEIQKKLLIAEAKAYEQPNTV